MRLSILLAALLLSGCAVSDFGKATTGSAVYRYESVKADGSKCVLEITSARSVSGGDVDIDKDCQLKSRADDAGGAKEAINKIAEIIQGVAM